MTSQEDSSRFTTDNFTVIKLINDANSSYPNYGKKVYEESCV